ncbi:7156_t:CDS:1, partial [Gigaspora margarita]
LLFDRQANYKVQVIFKNLAELCLRSSTVSDKWKISQIYTIPKGELWNFDLSKTRLIALLETFRKCVTRVLNRRLEKIFKEKNILRGLNFTNLLGNLTEEPVYLLNMLIEEAA